MIAAREAYRKFNIDRVGLVKGTNNPADALSKLRHNGRLRELLDTGIDNTPVESWIARTGMGEDGKEQMSNVSFG